LPLPNYRPDPGDILICDFDCGGFMPPEMVKKRPVVVVSHTESHGRELCTVVPLSTTAPKVVKAWHHPMPHLRIKGWPDTPTSWAKCDMVATVGYHRLNKPYNRTRHGRVYITMALHPADLAAIRLGLRALFGI
jgi:uncharacterized protein YifN (PemK superfamily)